MDFTKEGPKKLVVHLALLDLKFAGPQNNLENSSTYNNILILSIKPLINDCIIQISYVKTF